MAKIHFISSAFPISLLFDYFSLFLSEKSKENWMVKNEGCFWQECDKNVKFALQKVKLIFFIDMFHKF